MIDTIMLKIVPWILAVSGSVLVFGLIHLAWKRFRKTEEMKGNLMSKMLMNRKEFQVWCQANADFHANSYNRHGTRYEKCPKCGKPVKSEFYVPRGELEIVLSPCGHSVVTEWHGELSGTAWADMTKVIKDRDQGLGLIGWGEYEQEDK